MVLRGGISPTLADKSKSLVYASTSAEFANPDSNKLYLVDGVVDLGNQQIVVPSGGLHISNPSGARETSKLRSTIENAPLFINEAGQDAGNLVLENTTVELNGVGSSVFDLANDGSGVIEINNVNFTDAPSLGKVCDYRQLLIRSCGFFSIDDGLELDGNISGVKLVDSLVVSPTNDITLLKAGPALTIEDNIDSDVNFRAVGTGSHIVDLSPSNFASNAVFKLSGVKTSVTTPLPNFPSTSLAARFSDNIGVQSTYVGGQATFTNNPQTAIASRNTPYKLNGNTAYSSLCWFEGNNSNEFTYVGESPIDLRCEAHLNLTGGGSDTILAYFRVWRSATSAYEDLDESKVTGRGSLGNRSEVASLLDFITINPNDRVEVWVENTRDTTNVAVAPGGKISLTKR